MKCLPGNDGAVLCQRKKMKLIYPAYLDEQNTWSCEELCIIQRKCIFQVVWFSVDCFSCLQINKTNFTQTFFPKKCLLKLLFLSSLIQMSTLFSFRELLDESERTCTLFWMLSVWTLFLNAGDGYVMTGAAWQTSCDRISTVWLLPLCSSLLAHFVLFRYINNQKQLINFPSDASQQLPMLEKEKSFSLPSSPRPSVSLPCCLSPRFSPLASISDTCASHCLISSICRWYAFQKARLFRPSLPLDPLPAVLPPPRFCLPLPQSDTV